MKEKIETIYYPKNADFAIIKFDNGKEIGLMGIKAAQFQNAYCSELKDIPRAPIIVKNIELKGFDYDEVYEITEKDGDYVLFIFGSKNNYEMIISSNELKVVLNCDKK